MRCSVYSNIPYIEKVDGCVVAATDGKSSMGLYQAAPPSPTKTADSNIQLTGMLGSLSRALTAMDIQAPLVVGCRSEGRNVTFDVPTGKLLQVTRNFLCATSHTSGLPKEFSTLRISRMSTIKPYAPAAPDVTSSIMVIGLWTGHATNKQGKRCVIQPLVLNKVPTGTSLSTRSVEGYAFVLELRCHTLASMLNAPLSFCS